MALKSNVRLRRRWDGAVSRGQIFPFTPCLCSFQAPTSTSVRPSELAPQLSGHCFLHSSLTPAPFSLLCSSLWILSIGQSSDLMISPLCWVHTSNVFFNSDAFLFVCLFDCHHGLWWGSGQDLVLLPQGPMQLYARADVLNFWKRMRIQHHAGSFNLTMAEGFTSEKPADIMKQDLFAPMRAAFQTSANHTTDGFCFCPSLIKNVAIPPARCTQFHPPPGEDSFCFLLFPRTFIRLSCNLIGSDWLKENYGFINCLTSFSLLR